MSTTILTEVDIIIAGGGATGCLLAHRLSTAHPTLSILLIEGGPTNKNHPQIINPGLFITNLVPGSTTARFYTSIVAKEVNGREVSVAAGGCLGGGSSVNLMCYVRASASDYDAFGMEGWGSEVLIPLLKKHETIHLPKNEVNAQTHGWEGEFQISQGGTYHQEELMEDFLSASTAAGWDRTADPMDLGTGNAFGPLAAWIDPKTGHRQDAAHVLIHPLMDSQSTSLQVLTEHDVVRVLFNASKKATGVEILSHQNPTAPLTITARKLVVLSAGAFGSPLILERSGVGSQEVLDKIDVQPIYINPSVGNNYQDHPLIAWPYISSGSLETSLDCLLNGTLSVPDAPVKHNNILSSNHIEGIGKIRPNAADISSFSPESRLMGERFHTPGQYFSLGTALAYLYSRGYVHASSAEVKDKPVFDVRFFKEEVDIEMFVWIYKKQREIARRMERYRGPLMSCHPVFKEGSEASFEMADRDVGRVERGEVKGVKYGREDDDAIVECLRDRVGTMWHSLGTCAMKPSDEGGVVDGALNVYGVEGFKVADLSIVPKMVGANTYSTALLVGEKAAEIILKELKL
ncbi:GMC oxidoreductase [Cadophora sp. DSE1049]|nr:GMC oxidoreductase [Cadophora sp. DSE1049]